MIKLLDTFAGVGGFHLALEQSIGKENIKCIGFSEIDKFSKQVYKEHFNCPDLGDITKIDIDGLEDFDLLTGGFPCQDVSVAGKQNLEGGRTVLVEYLLQILEKKQPKYFIFENVKGLMGKKFDTFRESIFNRIKDAGYVLSYKILNTKDFGLPQNRERVFIIGARKGHTCLEEEIENMKYWEFSFPQGQELTTFFKDILEEEVDDILVKNFNIRKLTPTEYCRLQGFPDTWNDSVSNSQRYKQMGNAISVPVVKSIFDNLFNNYKKWNK